MHGKSIEKNFNIGKIISSVFSLKSVGRIATPLLKLPITKVVIKVNIKGYRFMQLKRARKRWIGHQGN
jgi:hypothetical protein